MVYVNGPNNRVQRNTLVPNLASAKKTWRALSAVTVYFDRNDDDLTGKVVFVLSF